MGNDGPAVASDNILGLAEQVNLFAEDADSGDFVPLVTEQGTLRVVIATESGNKLTDPLYDVGSDELRTRLLGLDDAGSLQEGQVEALDTSVAAGSTSILTYLSRALNSQAQDQLLARITDSTGSQVDPATQTLENALKANDADEFVTRVTDSTGAEIDPATQALEGALQSDGSDEIRVNLQATGIQLPVDQQDALEKSAEQYGYAIDANTSVSLQIDGYTTVDVVFVASAATDITVERSWDGSNWFTVDSATGVTDYQPNFTDVTAKHVRVSITGTGTSGDTADVVIGAAP